jgi:hypothetical protein
MNSQFPAVFFVRIFVCSAKWQSIIHKAGFSFLKKLNIAILWLWMFGDFFSFLKQFLSEIYTRKRKFPKLLPQCGKFAPQKKTQVQRCRKRGNHP